MQNRFKNKKIINPWNAQNVNLKEPHKTWMLRKQSVSRIRFAPPASKNSNFKGFGYINKPAF
jgi:hypothetical protein